MAHLETILAAAIPTDHARQVHVRDVLEESLAARPGIRLLDLGCGDGRALDIVQRHGDNVQYTGIDIEDSPEVRSRTRVDAAFETFDGINIPFPDDSFDCVFSCSVLEHVRHPEPLLREVCRVLKPGGMFIGSVSFLEPFHSYSIFNFTPYGLWTVLNDVGLNTLSLRPGIDGLTITMRGLGYRAPFNRWFHTQSPLNVLIHFAARMKRKSVAWENAKKLSVCGQIVFVAEK